MPLGSYRGAGRTGR